MENGSKGILKVVLIIAVVIAVIFGVVMCSKKCDNGSNNSVDGGNTDYSDYTKILSIEDLKSIGSGGKYVLNSDIDLSGVEWTPIADFSGTIDGQGHEIRNMTITSADASDIGFVGTIRGTICNLTLSDVNIEVSARDANVGGVAGSSNGGKLDNVYVSGSIKANRSASCGGVIGYITKSKFTRTSAYNTDVVGKTNVGGQYGKISGMGLNNYTDAGSDGNTVSGETNVGGLAGYVEYAKDMSDLKNTGNVSGESCVGGIFGYLHCDGKRTLSSFTNNGDVTGTGDNVGGIIGKVNGKSAKLEMDNFNNSGYVAGGVNAGGLFGYFYAGYTYTSTLQNSKSSSKVLGKYNVGGISGHAEFLSIEKCSNEGSEITASGYNLENGEKRVYLGGYVGSGSSIGFTDCVNGVSLSATGGACYVGGLAGYVEYAKEMSDLKNTGNVSGESCVGGVFGYLHCDGKRTLSSFTNNGDVTGTGDNVGGIIGKVNGKSAKLEMDDFNNSGYVTGEVNAGGLFGYFYAGYTYTSTLQNSKSSCKVSGRYNVGGISGHAEYLSIEKCSNKDSEITASGYNLENGEKRVYLGGYVGSGSSIGFTDCVNGVSLSATGGVCYVGGLAGYVEYAGNMSDLKNTGNVSGESCVGGIFGYLHCSSNRTLSSFANEGEIIGTGDNVGGIIGKVNCKSAKLEMDNFNNSGYVTGGVNAGGLFGYFYASYTSHLYSYSTSGNVCGDSNNLEIVG